MARIGKYIETESRYWLPRVCRVNVGVQGVGENQEWLLNGRRASLGGDENIILWMVVQLCEYTKNHLKMANFIYVDFISTFKNCPKYFFNKEYYLCY